MLVSIIVPCYNQADFLEEALQSVLMQTYENWECIIVNDGSIDNTEKISKGWELKDHRFKYVFKENGGVSSARNLGIEKANGDFLQFLDCDDVLGVDKLRLSIEAINNHTNKAKTLVISNFKMLSFDSSTELPPFCKLKKEYFTWEGFLYEWNQSFSLQVQCGFFKNELFEEIRFPENLSAQEDWMVWLQIMKLNPKVEFINQPLAYYRVHPNSRMQTLGVDDNQIKLLDNLAEILTYKEYVEYSKVALERSYEKNLVYKFNLQKVKDSNSFQTGLMIKKILKGLKLLKPSRLLFRNIIKLKK